MEGRRELHTLVDLANHTPYMHRTKREEGGREGGMGRKQFVGTAQIRIPRGKHAIHMAMYVKML